MLSNHVQSMFEYLAPRRGGGGGGGGGGTGGLNAVTRPVFHRKTRQVILILSSVEFRLPFE